MRKLFNLNKKSERNLNREERRSAKKEEKRQESKEYKAKQAMYNNVFGAAQAAAGVPEEDIQAEQDKETVERITVQHLVEMEDNEIVIGIKTIIETILLCQSGFGLASIVKIANAIVRITDKELVKQNKEIRDDIKLYFTYAEQITNGFVIGLNIGKFIEAIFSANPILAVRSLVIIAGLVFDVKCLDRCESIIRQSMNKKKEAAANNNNENTEINEEDITADEELNKEMNKMEKDSDVNEFKEETIQTKKEEEMTNKPEMDLYGLCDKLIDGNDMDLEWVSRIATLKAKLKNCTNPNELAKCVNELNKMENELEKTISRREALDKKMGVLKSAADYMQDIEDAELEESMRASQGIDDERDIYDIIEEDYAEERVISEEDEKEILAMGFEKVSKIDC